MSRNLLTALDYAETLGWALLPIGTRSKKPNCKVLRKAYGSTEWRHLADEPADPDAIRAWFEIDPETGVGVLTGQPSGVVVADYDRGLPPQLDTPTAATSRGQHLYFGAGDDTQTRGFACGELRGDGAYVVAPYSLHPSGDAYRWLKTPEPGSLLDFHPDLLAPKSPLRPNLNIEVGTSGWGDLWLARVLVALGVSARSVSSAFRCPLPGHEEQSPSASLFRMYDGNVMMRCWHGRGARPWYPLVDVFASVTLGHEVKLGRGERNAWDGRLEVAAGLRELDLPTVPPLPPDATSDMRKVADGFAELLAIEDGRPAPYTRRFVERWTGLSERRCRDAIDRLIAADVLRAAQWRKLYGRQKGTPFFEFGKGWQP